MISVVSSLLLKLAELFVWQLQVFGHYLLRKIVRGVMLCSACFVVPYSRFQNRRVKHRNIPTMKSHLLEIPAVELAVKIRTRQVKCEEVILAYIQRVQEVNPYLNAVVEERFEAALEEAREVDRLLESGTKTLEALEKETPLLGIPLTVKESIAVEGMSNQGGRVYPSKQVALQDAPIVANMRRAGAIILLVSNTPELCLNWETYNNVTGLTKNPHNQKLTPGGSSGGEAALIASGASLIGLTSDIAGSSRLPAMFVGIFGHKPTPYAVSPLGHAPGSSDKKWGSYFTTAPMCRYAVDLPLALECMRDPQGAAITPLREVPLSSMRFFYMPNDGPSGTLRAVDPEIEAALLKTAAHFGAKRVDIKLLKYALDFSMSAMLRIEGIETIFTKPDEPGKPCPSVSGELLRFYMGKSDSIFPSIAIGLLQNLNKILVPESRHRTLDKLIERLKEQFRELLGSDGVFIYPTFPTTAHQHYEVYHKLTDATYMMIFNTIGFPATNVIVGKDRRGLPMGVQLVTAPGCDHLSLIGAQEVERLFGGWVKPPMDPRATS